MLFSEPMVKAILNGTKTQTRRIIQPSRRKDGVKLVPELLAKMGVGAACPHGAIGDILWVRETFKKYGDKIYFKADGGVSIGGHWRPSLFMLRSDCRIFLKITNLRVERLNEISSKDAFDEGIDRADVIVSKDTGEMTCVKGSVEYFKDLWESINGKGSWEQNPWVWVIEFERL